MAKTISRKQFLNLGVALAGGQLLATAACSDDEGNETTGTGATGGSSGDGGSTGDGGDGSGQGGSGATTSQGGSGQGGSGQGGTGQGGAGGGGDLCTAMVTADISLNHAQPHVLEIPLADIMAGAEKTYDTTGPATHCHRVTVTAADFDTLKSGGSVTLVSCNGGDHEYVLSCVAGAPAPEDPMCDSGDSTGQCT
jgi:hypothetical protein